MHQFQHHLLTINVFICAPYYYIMQCFKHVQCCYAIISPIMGSMKILKAAAALIALLHMALLALRSQSVLQLAQRLLPAVASQVGISLTAE